MSARRELWNRQQRERQVLSQRLREAMLKRWMVGSEVQHPTVADAATTIAAIEGSVAVLADGTRVNIMQLRPAKAIDTGRSK